MYLPPRVTHVSPLPLADAAPPRRNGGHHPDQRDFNVQLVFSAVRPGTAGRRPGWCAMTSQPTPRRSRRLFVILGALVVVAGLGVAAYFLWFRPVLPEPG